MTATGVSSQSPPDKEERQSVECPPDTQLPENSQENLDTRLDHAMRKPFRPVIRSLSPLPKGLSLSVLARMLVPHRRTTSRPRRSGTRPSTFWIRSGKPCTTSLSKHLEQPVTFTIVASTTSDKQVNRTQRQRGPSAPVSGS